MIIMMMMMMMMIIIIIIIIIISQFMYCFGMLSSKGSLVQRADPV